MEDEVRLDVRLYDKLGSNRLSRQTGTLKFKRAQRCVCLRCTQNWQVKGAYVLSLA